jgi:predicted DNA-binding transcriptional regulator YafY
MKNERLIAMTDYLLHCGRKTAEELASRFEVSTRTIYRDIDSLCAAGVPIVAEAGTGGGYELEEGYRIDRSFLSEDEIADLSALLEGLGEAVKDKHLERSLGKISALGPRGRELARDCDCVRLPPPLIATLSPWGAAGGDPALIRELRRAIAERRIVTFGYVDGEARETERSVEPCSLVIGGTTWYLHGWCRLRRAYRLFKVNRMRNPRLSYDRFDPYAHLPAPSPFAFSDSTEIPVPIVLSVEARLHDAMEESFPGAGTGPAEDGRWTYRFNWPLGNYLIHFLLYFGPGLSVLEPAELRTCLAASAYEIARSNDF